MEHVDRLFTPVIQKIEPSAVSLASRQLDVTRVYARELLELYHLQNLPASKRREAEDIAFDLVWLFPDHGYVIWRDRARKLGLNIVDGEDDAAWRGLEKAFRELGGRSGSSVRLLTDDEFQSAYVE